VPLEKFLNRSIIALLVASCFAAGSSHAQNYPDHPIRLIVGTAPGGTQDGTARMVSKEVESLLGQPIVVDNRGGANGIIGYDLVAKSAPDGYTLLHTAVAFAINATVYKKLPFDVSRDFIPVTTIAVGQGALIVIHSSVPAHSAKELVELAKQKQLTYSSPGIGNGMHLITEAFNARAGIKMLHVPYKGAGPALNALLSAEVQVMMIPPLIVAQHIKAGRLRALAYSGVKRLDVMPDMPLISEAGYPGFHMDSGWHGWFAPAKTPQAVINKLYTSVQKAIATPKMKEFFVSIGYDPGGESPEQFRKTFEADKKRWGEIARMAKITADE
jgi:tripartite-type tricarboxylate transporter receptor subunit TctC